VQDLFLTETAELADVVLPAATWGEKTGCFTNADRTVHISDKAVEPPGTARPDLDIFLDFARRMDLRDKDGGPLITWTDAEGAFEAWKACSAGRLCDYTGLSHALLRQAPSGIQWPCNAEHPEGTERLYADGRFWARPAECETYTKDLETGAAVTEDAYKAKNPEGKAMLRAAAYSPPPEEPGEAYPLWLTTGRTIYHFHTRTKTGRAPQLNGAARDVWVEMSPDEAARQGLAEGDLAEITSARGSLRARVRVSAMRDGVLFVPFHYGYFDVPDGPPAERDHAGRAANESTITAWDPASKQPLFKTCAARITLAERAGDGEYAPAPTTAGSAPAGQAADTVPATVGGPDALATSTRQD
jgi:anaerobic selenocysteine-containing dehydrogenase